MDHDGQLRNLRDFLLVYNRMTEICFQRCTSNFNYRNLTMDEERCVDNCAGKLIRTNHRLMGTYVQLMPTMMQRRMQEMENKAAEAAKAEAEAAAQGGASALESTTTVTDPSPVSPSASEFPATSSSVMETPSATADHTLTLGLTKSSTPPELRGSHITSAHNEISEVQAPETVKLSTSSVSNQASLSSVTDNTQTFTTESSGLVTASPVISTPSGSSVPSSKVGVGSVSSAVAAIPVEKLDLKSSNITATPVPETRSTGGAGQNTKTTS